MARVDVIMPQMGESIAEGTLSKWVKQVGDAVKRDETIFEISTDKVDAEIPAPSAGILAEVIVLPGQTVPVGTIVARIETDVAAYEAGGSAGGAAGGAAAASTPAEAATAAPSAAASPSAAAAAPAVSAPAATNGNAFEDRIRTKSSPLVRKMAAEHGVDLASLRGSGIAGRVTRKDLEAALAAGTAKPAVAPAPGASHFAPAGVVGAPGGTPLPEPWPGDKVEPMSRIRAITAARMVESKHTSAHVTSVFEVDLTRIARLRAARKREFEQAGVKLTFLPFLVRAVTAGLRAHPVLNAAVRGSDIIYRQPVNIGLAVAMEWGLIVPVLKRADERSLLGLARGIADLADRARMRKLAPEEVQGGTFTITNYGVKGSLIGTPIIPQPQVAILGFGAIEKRPKVVTGPDGEDTIAIRTCAYLALSFDHRIIDGADADGFLTDVKRFCEQFPED